MKFMQILLLLIFPVFLFSCNKQLSEDEQIIRYAEKRDTLYKFFINEKIPGNFTGSQKNELLVCFDTQDKHSKEHWSDYSMVFVFNEYGKIEQGYDLYFKKNCSSDINFIKEIKMFDLTYKNTVITDFNKNGKLELIYYIAEGSVFPFFIEEFQNGGFKHICQVYDGKKNIPGLDNYDLTHFDFENKSMYLSQRVTNKKIKLIWNSETEFYEKEVLEE